MDDFIAAPTTYIPSVEHTSYSMIYWSMWLIYVDLNYISKLIKDRGWKLA